MMPAVVTMATVAEPWAIRSAALIRYAEAITGSDFSGMASDDTHLWLTTHAPWRSPTRHTCPAATSNSSDRAESRDCRATPLLATRPGDSITAQCQRPAESKFRSTRMSPHQPGPVDLGDAGRLDR